MQEARTRRAAAGIAMLMHYTAHGSRQLRRHQPHVLVTATRADALRHVSRRSSPVETIQWNRTSEPERATGIEPA
jgi:hypothetical protein